MFCYVWEYRVRPDRIREFEAGYGPDGDWVALFRPDPDYLRTELIRDHGEARRFMTIDYWRTREACMAFRDRFAREFGALDEHFDSMTESETHLGDFIVLEP